MKILASFSQTIECKYGIKSYQSAKNTYDWMLKSIYKMKKAPENVSSEFDFRIGDISCSCRTIEEFIENAYGAHMFSLSTMHILALDINIYLCADSRNVVIVSANSKRDLEEMVGLLDSTDLGTEEINDPISVIYIERQDNSVTVNGDRNVVANNHSIMADKQEKKESKTSNWIQGICQGILANLMWWILGVVAVALLARAISNGYISG